MLCDACKQIFLSPVFGKHVVHQPTYEVLRTSALHGCEICNLLYSGVLRDTASQWDLSETDAERLHLQTDSLYDRTSLLSEPQASTAFNVWLTKEDLANPSELPEGGYDFFSYKRNLYASSVRLLSRHELSELRTSIALRLKIELLSGSLPSLIGRQVSRDCDLSLYRDWLSSCTSSHMNCSRFVPKDMPSRLLALDGAQPRLALTDGHRGIYATLSHCWGTSTTGFQLPVTTSRNLASRLQSMSLEKLPRLFQDVIKIVRGLGIHFIWIDCLCIVQDDELDWQKECSRMGAIYANSAIAIAGPGAPDASFALLKGRVNSSARHFKPQVTSTFTYFDTPTTVLVRQMLDAQSEPRYVERKEFPDPLSLRGWAVQERLLAPRILYVGSEQMYMECNSASFFEDVQFALKPHPLKQALVPGTAHGELIGVWYELVAHYSYCNITNGNDKLPALSGLASMIAQRTGDAYYAGLWSSDLVRGLTWSRIHFRDEQKNTARSFYPTNRSLPSWSWASCDRAIGYHHHSRPFYSFVQNVSIKVSVHGQDPYGHVDEGILTLTARVKKATLSMIHSEEGGVSFSDLQIINNTDFRTVGRVWLDKVGSRTELHKLWQGIPVGCVLLGQYGEPIDFEYNTWLALVVQPCQEQPGCFRRIGLAKGGWNSTTAQADWFDAERIEEIRVI